MRRLTYTPGIDDNMSVVAEFTIPASAFAFGEALGTEPPVKVTLERLFPAGNRIVAYVWITESEFETFEDTVRERPYVHAFERIDSIDGSHQYRVEWDAGLEDLLAGIQRAEGVILQASGVETWTFQLRFPNHDRLEEFYSYVTDHDIDLDVDRVYVLADQSTGGPEFDLTLAQREALMQAVRRGYFKVPRDVTMGTIADDLGISNQAASERIRRGTDSILRAVLLGET